MWIYKDDVYSSILESALLTYSCERLSQSFPDSHYPSVLLAVLQLAPKRRLEYLNPNHIN